MSSSAALMGYLPLILVFVIFYFLVLRPQARQAQAHKEMLATLTKGATIVTLGGIHGEITKVNDATFTITTGTTEIVIEKSAISRLISAAPEPKSRHSKKKK